MSDSKPIRLLNEAVGKRVDVELVTGEFYVGHLEEIEDNMNCRLTKITARDKDGRVYQMQYIFIRGSMIRFISVPDVLASSPLFLRVGATGIGRSSSGIVEGQMLAKKRKRFRKKGEGE
ncbi:putative multi-domain containing protein [Aduncisulcus paluster]|uniref:Small nuclear ribonucleoprotein Sm D3 n=1 Tax=Aduncisulcus paluster TaxID=2918883 RepID=A0ABQ5KKK0_9EUKA|nr:putative multi-domain containing protein [Aduncisulcus paluster]|eukprot:gnl/Carplike_NY0171/2097_a2821_995.p1 GENE.gnl/Carplike_NY0171/2097_a2821_995~~gnl/Carplike_NY0171/2097_a2821_995.p1  ORF type:complete len:119 (-),score=16.31 gnl/Carplike_NY0171/2097_a2821_995:90-446(-)